MSIQVSVAVITYNMEYYLEDLLNSILKQKVNFDYEIIIDDDHSPDHSRDIIKKYQKKYSNIIKPIYRDTNVGGSQNMYGVLNNCNGKYIAILEGDDFWEDENKLQYQYDFMESHIEYIGMTCNSWCEFGKEVTMNTLMRNRTEPKVFTIKDYESREFHDRLPTSTDTWFFKNIFKLYPDKDFSVFYKAHNMVWDQSLILILYGLGNIYADSKVVSHHRSVTSLTGTNYQSLIRQKNVLYEDSYMYMTLENYMLNNLHINPGKFYLARGDTWINAKFKSLLTKDSKDKEIERKIWYDQHNKLMLIKLFILKSINIIERKLGFIK